MRAGWGGCEQGSIPALSKTSSSRESALPWSALHRMWAGVILKWLLELRTVTSPVLCGAGRTPALINLIRGTYAGPGALFASPFSGRAQLTRPGSAVSLRKKVN